MRAFDDFDAWGEAVSGASLRLVCDAVEVPRWTLGMLELGEVVLQFAAEGGGNICYGANVHTGPILFLPLTHAAEHVVNGASLDGDSLLAIPRGADFSICVRRVAHAWCSIALPPGVVVPEATSASRRVTCPPGGAQALATLVRRIAANLADRPPGSFAHRAAGSELLAAAVASLPKPSPSPAAMGRPRLDRAAIIRRAMEAIDESPTLLSAADLSRAAGVTPRTLQRSFQETFGMAPRRYLACRELHHVRRLLSRALDPGVTVADVLARRGIWEFGRFAGRYRRHFGEVPSETLRRRTRR